MDLQFPRGGHSGSRLCNKAGHVYARCINGSQDSFMGQPRPRKWDRGQDSSMGQGGPVYGTGLRGFGLEDWVGPRAPGMGRD